MAMSMRDAVVQIGRSANEFPRLSGGQALLELPSYPFDSGVALHRFGLCLLALHSCIFPRSFQANNQLSPGSLGTADYSETSWHNIELPALQVL